MMDKTFIKTIPLSEAQKDYYLHDLVYPMSPYYQEQYLFRFESRLDVSVTLRVLYEIVKRHEIYRSIFVLEDEPIQKVYSEPVVDFEHVSSATWDDTMIREYFNEEFNKPFTLEEGPLFSCRLLDDKESGSILSFKYHHICFDGWSVSLTLDEFTMIYQLLITGNDQELQPQIHQYADFVEWEQKYIASQEGEAARVFWKKKLGGNLERLEVPADKKRPSTPSFKGGISFFTFTRELRDELIAYHKHNKYPTDVIYLSLFSALLYRIAGQDDVIVGVPRYGRPKREFHTIMGPCMVMLPLRIKIPKNSSLRELAKQIHEELSLCSQYQNYPISLITAELQYERDKKYASFFSTAFVHQKAIKQDAAIMLGNAQNTFDSNGLTVSIYPIGKDVSQYDLCLVVEKDNHHDILAGFEYNSDILDEETIAKWVADFERTSLYLLKNDRESIPVYAGQPNDWMKSLTNLPSLKILPEDDIPLSTDSIKFEQETFEWACLQEKGISQLVEVWDTSSYAIFVTAFLVLLYAETEKEDLALAFRAGWDESEDVPSALLLRADLSGNPLLGDLVLQVQSKLKEAHYHQVSFPKPHEPQLLFEMNENEFPSTIDFQFRIHESNDHINGTITYRANVFKRETVQRICTHYEYLLENVTAEPHRRIREIVSHLNSQFLTSDDFEQLFL
ncbi:condensation domain-containing protein [Brevibacillus sp. DP1.3A]|uniref:condensation domain-containing protein n=1 Tax=Brevibacillus sp. DP1.3A TaxID=2738867 RepID=UPI00156BCF61|nr:condensation domain-containing protein [Brevibacillus sp. DP1.3A]UED75705.1 condensation domain-containing protein [Brevibacillus sp. DP1.3A]